MPSQVACTCCGIKLKLPDNFSAPTAQCPRCGTKFSAGELRAAEPDNALQEVALDEVDPGELPAESVPSEPNGESPPRRKKKRRRRKKRSGPDIPVWAWWLGAGIGGTFVLLAFILTLMFGLKRDALPYCLALAIMLPISTGILIISMFVSSAAGGGIDFGDATEAIPKAAGLLFVISAMSVMPCGYAGSILTLPVWIVGLMTLFRLDFWETRLLVTVNFALNLLCKLVLVLAIIPLLSNAGTQWDPIEDRRILTDLGAHFQYAAGSETTIVGLRMSGSEIDDDVLVRLRALPDLQLLDLSYSEVSDAGLHYIHQLDHLKTVNLSHTRVTKAGARDLQRILPEAAVVY